MSFLPHRQEKFSTLPASLVRNGELNEHGSGREKTFKEQLLHPDSVTPYLGLRARLSQVWINRWTVLLFLVLVRTLIALSSMHRDIESARREALSACNGVQSMGSAMASMPHYLSQGVNSMTADGIERAVSGLMTMLTLSVTAVEELILFVIHLLTSTYLCLITMAVSSNLHSAISLIETVTDFLGDQLPKIGDDISSAVEDFQHEMNDFMNGLGDAYDFFGGDAGKVPTINLNGQISALDNFQLPSGLDADLQKLNASIPTFDEVQDFTDSAIRWPFEQIKKLINESLPDYKFDRSLFPVPEKEQMEFCSDNNDIDQFFDGLQDIGADAKRIGIIVLVILAILVMIPMAYLEMRRWRKMNHHAQVINSNSCDPLDVVYIASRPYTASAGLKAAGVTSSAKSQSLIRWALAYATTVPALFVLSLGISGLFACFCQWMILRAVQKEAPKLAHQVEEFAEKVVNSLEKASENWANGTNEAIIALDKRINDDVFGWVDTSTTGLNNTLNTFVDKTTDVLKDTFGGTILYEPISEIFYCLIQIKIEGIEKALTWVHDHAHVDFPLVPKDTFSLGAAASISDDSKVQSFLADPSQGTSDQITGAVDRLISSFEDGLRSETIISSALIGLWVFIVLIGILAALFMAFDRNKTASYIHSQPPSSRISEDSATFLNEKAATMGTGALNPNPPPAPPPLDPARPPEVQYLAPSHYNPRINPSSAGNTYKGVQYTIDRRPAPTFDQEGDRESYGYAGARTVGNVQRPTHQRKSSHANLGAMTPGVGRAVTFDGMGH